MRLLISSRVIADWTRSFSSGSIQTLFNPPPSKLAASLFWFFRLIRNPPLSCRDLRLPRSQPSLPSSPLPSLLAAPSPLHQPVARSLLALPPSQDLQCGNLDPWLSPRSRASSSPRPAPRSSRCAPLDRASLVQPLATPVDRRGLSGGVRGSKRLYRIRSLLLLESRSLPFSSCS